VYGVLGNWLPIRGVLGNPYPGFCIPRSKGIVATITLSGACAGSPLDRVSDRHCPRYRTGRGPCLWEEVWEDHVQRLRADLHRGCCAGGHSGVPGGHRLDLVRILRRRTRLPSKERGTPFQGVVGCVYAREEEFRGQKGRGVENPGAKTGWAL
jgi:hypothetical protein